MESEICTKMLKKWSEKLTAKFPTSTYKFFDLKQDQQKVNHCSKKKRKGEKGKAKKIQKLKSFKAWTSFSGAKILISTHAQAEKLKNAILVTRRASCRVANAFSTRLKLIWPRSSLKTAKMSQKTQKAPGVSGLNL